MQLLDNDQDLISALYGLLMLLPQVIVIYVSSKVLLPQVIPMIPI